MNANTHRNEIRERELRRLLAEAPPTGPALEPPADLLAKLQEEIPDSIELHPALRGGENVLPFRAPVERIPMARRRVWLIAAGLIAMAGAGYFSLRLRDVVPLTDHAGSSPVASPPRGDEVPTGVEAFPESAAPTDGSEAGIQSPSGPPAPPPPDFKALDYLGGPPASEPAPEKEKVWVGTEADLGLHRRAPTAEAQGRVNDAIRRRQGQPKPVQPVEVPEVFDEGVEGGVEGGVPGGVVGGVPGGVPGGVMSGAAAPSKRAESPKPAASTGGTDEPNDKPYGDVFFDSAGINPFVDTDEDRLSTFGLDVDTGSFTVIRRYLEDGHRPDPASVRLEEVVNFFDYGDPAPARGDFAVRLEGAPNPFGPQGGVNERHRLVRVGIKTREVDAARRKPSVLTFVVDVSGSMDQENRLGLVKRALGLLLAELREDDRVGLVIFGSEARTILEPTTDRSAIREAIDRLRAEGSTNAEAGLSLAYDVARRAYRPDANNRLILCSDGVANVGNTGPQSILKRIGTETRHGIDLSTVGFGMGNYNDVLMEQLADKGDGRYAYVDTIEEARRIFVEGLAGTLQTIAKDAKVQVEFDPKVVQSWRLLGYENRDIADDKFRDDTVDAGDIGAGHAVTALYEVKLAERPAAGKAVATVHLRWFSKESGRVIESVQALPLDRLANKWKNTSPAFRLATLAGQFAEILRGSHWAKGESPVEVARRARELADDTSGKLHTQAIDLATLAELAVRAK
ncbi:MAG TPA: von Willebrand factor type A domain-containing protein [Thermoanaerobaculia bacterium]|jgi:Ca-activated chloride channel family protein|nr:von Willebrand factor type A domain-containing protein [Thermoanaerobaculia bacterium]